VEPRGGVKTTIALVSLTPFFGGGEVYYERLCELLRDNLEMHAIVACNELARRIANVADVTVVRGGSGLRRLEAARDKLRELVVSRPIQLVHLNGQAEANLVPTCRRMIVPCVITRHTDLSLQSGGLKRVLYRRNAARADAVICVSHAVAQQQDAFVAPEKLHVIPHWVPVLPEFERPKNRRFTVLFLGRMEGAKGVKDLLAAAGLLPDIQFVFAGDGPLRDDADQYGLANVEVLGFRDDVAALLGSADLLVNPSHSEGSSLVVLEAMAAGVPCLVSDIPVLREIVRDGRTGAIFPCGDAVRLAEAIETLRQDAVKRASLTVQARKIVREENASERVRERYRRIFERLTTKNPTLRSAQDGAPGLRRGA
jgi:glycosyltransferase involved in cell wall biosynthesis